MLVFVMLVFGSIFLPDAGNLSLQWAIKLIYGCAVSLIGLFWLTEQFHRDFLLQKFIIFLSREKQK